MKNVYKYIIILIISLIIVFSGFYIIYADSSVSEPPRAGLTASLNETIVDEEIQFDGSESNGNIVEWLWDFGDGNTSEGESVSYRFSRSDYYTVKLTVVTKDDKSDTAEIIIVINNNDFSSETSGSNMPGLPRALANPVVHNWDELIFPILNGTTVPQIKAVWRGSGYGEIWTSIGPEFNVGSYYAETQIIAGNFEIEYTVESSEVESYGDIDTTLALGLICHAGEVSDYYMSVEVIYSEDLQST